MRGCCFSRPNEFIAEYHKPDEGRNVKGAKRRGTREPLTFLTLSGILQEAKNLVRLKQPIEQIWSPAGSPNLHASISHRWKPIDHRLLQTLKRYIWLSVNSTAPILINLSTSSFFKTSQPENSENFISPHQFTSPLSLGKGAFKSACSHLTEFSSKTLTGQIQQYKIIAYSSLIVYNYTNYKCLALTNVQYQLIITNFG